MEDRSSRCMRTLVTQMAPSGLSGNEIARALIPMMARSTRGSNQRPDTLMQDRTPASSMKVLLQRTAGPYIWVNRDRTVGGEAASYVRFAPWSNCCLAADYRT